MKLNLESRTDPLAPIYILVIFGQKDYIQFNYPEDFIDEESIKTKIIPRTEEEVELMVSQSRIGVGWVRFKHSSKENIQHMLDFNGKSARCGLSLEDFQNKVSAQKVAVGE